MMGEQQIGQWIAIGIVVAFVAFEKAKKLFKNSNNPGNPGYGERIAKLEQAVSDMREDIKTLFRKANGLK